MPFRRQGPEPLPPLPSEPEDLNLTEEGKRKAWRLLTLLETLTRLRPNEPVNLDEIDQLGRVAVGHHDLHDACAALVRGCSIELLPRIFT